MEYLEAEKHYQLLYYNNNINEDILYINNNNINEIHNNKTKVDTISKLNILPKTNCYDNIDYIENKNKNNIEIYSFNLNYIKHTGIKDLNISNINNEIKKDYDLHKGSDYPIYPLDADDPENFYANIYNYLIKRNLNQNAKNYPTYSYNYKENIEKKRAFRRKASNFAIDKDGYLCYKKPDNNRGDDSFKDSEDNLEKDKSNKDIQNNNNNNILTKKELIKSGKYSLFKIPFKCNEYNLIKEIHEKINHRNIDDTRKEFKRLKYYYYRYTLDINIY